VRQPRDPEIRLALIDRNTDTIAKGDKSKKREFRPRGD
jgi:hypothetical protein